MRGGVSWRRKLAEEHGGGMAARRRRRFWRIGRCSAATRKHQWLARWLVTQGG